MASVGEALVKLLEGYGTQVIFGIPGVHNVELYRGLSKSTIRHVTPRHEQGAGFMADGYARASGRPGVCFTISGPGLTNILTAMGQAYADSVPLLVISSVNATTELGTNEGRLHELPSQRDLARGVSAFAQTIHHPRQLPEALARAMAIFAGARPRPVYLEIPVDVIALPADGLDLKPRALPSRPAADPAAIARAAELLDGAARPLIVVGGGGADAADALRRLAERLDAPVATTINAKGVLPPDHPLLAGENLAAPPLYDALEDADVILAVGTEFGETEMYPGPVGLVIDGSLIRIDLDAEQLMRGPVAAVPILADAALALAALAEALPPADGARHGAAQAAALRNGLIAQLPDYAVTHQPIMAVVDRVLPDAVIVGDSTEPVYGANQFFHPRGVRRFFNASTGYGTLGYGLPAGIGAKVAVGEQPVVVLAGDGGVLFTIPELAAAVEARVPVIVLLWNNGGYGEIKKYMEARSITPIAVDLVVPDLVAVARGFGCHAVTVGNLEHLATELDIAKGRSVPTFLELKAEMVFR